MAKIITLHHTSNTDYIMELTRLYIDVFSAPPRNETINFDETFKMMKKDMNNGYIKVVLNDDNKMIGSTTVKPTSLFSDHKSLELNTNSLYLSNIMLKKESRGLGIGKKMICDMIKTREAQIIYSRCREDAMEIRFLFENNNFKIIKTYTTIMNKTSAVRLIYQLT